MRATGYTGEIGPREHAEEVAPAKLAGRIDLSRDTICSSLEPCAARRSQPLSCTGAILAAGIARVVFAMREPLLFADCHGVELLRQGVEVVEVGELAHLVAEINNHVLDQAGYGVLLRGCSAGWGLVWSVECGLVTASCRGAAQPGRARRSRRSG